MKMKQICEALLFALLVCASVLAQTISGNMVGTVMDSSGAAVPNVNVELKNTSTGFARTTATGAEGVFRFNSLDPARYEISIKPSTGFKAYSQKDIILSANENRDLGKIVLALGAVTEEISVTAAPTPVQTASSENSKLVDSTQVANITVKGRDLFGLLAMLPGVTSNSADSTGNFSLTSVTINGPTSNAADAKINFQVDGVRSVDVGSNMSSTFEPNLDTVAEIRVLTTNYQAEYGSGSAGQIAVVTKGGGEQFHGSAWVNWRHEQFNANSFFNNYNSLAKSQYRFLVGGYSIGGPVAVPKAPRFIKKKLFFFASNEFTHQKPGTSNIYGMVATPAQRQGNFAGYSDGNGKAYSLRDPTTGGVVPANNLTPFLGVVGDRASATTGQAILNFFPLPNLCNAASGTPAPSGCITDPDSTQSYKRNYYTSFVSSHPRTNTLARLDWNVTSKLSAWVRFINDADITYANAQIGLKNGQGQWSPYYVDDPYPGNGWAVNATYAINPTTVNQFTFGRNYSTFAFFPHDTSQVQRSMMGNPPSFTDFAKDPQFAGEVNLPRPSGLPNGPQNFGVWVPAVSFGGGQEPGETGFAQNAGGNQLPYQNWYYVYTANDTLSKTWRNHNFKAGVYYDHNNKYQAYAASNYLGQYVFTSNGAMTNDVQDGFGNAYLGNFSNYNEGKKVAGFWPVTSVEFFLQDTWRVSRRFTLDLGYRFYHDPSYPNINGNSAVFVRSTYNPAQAERLYYPACKVPTTTASCNTANSYAVDPATGTQTYFALAGTFVPPSVGGYSGTPNPFPGMQVEGTNGLPHGLYEAPFLAGAFRFGFAWDVFGNGKTAIRGGVGDYLNRGSVDQTLFYAGLPPVAYSRNIYYTSVSQISSYANTAAISPFGGGGITGKQKLEGAYTGSFMIQQDVGLSTVLEASWVFNLRRHYPMSRAYNFIPMFAQYNPSWASPMAGYLYANAQGKNLNDNYFRPMPGLGQMSETNFQGSGDYHALQVSVRRNMTKHLSYGLAYTLAKAMSGSSSPYWPDKYRNWGPSFSPTPHVLTANWVYEAPNLGRRLNLKPLGWITDHWTASGIYQFRSNRMSGVSGISFSGTNAVSNAQANWTGSAEGARMLVVGNWQLPQGQASFVGGAAVATLQGSPATQGYGANGTPGNQLIDTSAFLIPFPCSYTPASNLRLGVGQNLSCFGNAGSGSLIKVPGTITSNFDMTFTKNFPLKSERRVVMVRAEMYNIFNHTQFSGYNISAQYDWSNWKNGNLVQTNSGLGRYTGAMNPRQMSMSLRFQF